MGEKIETGVHAPRRKCFVVGEFGKDDAERKRSSQVLKYLIRAALAKDFDVVRADEIADEGQITDQIVRHLVEDDLVVADLSRPNPNVYYEVGVRHSAAKPVIHLMEDGQRLPFDVQGQRAIAYDITDIESVEKARDSLRRAVDAIAAADWKAGKNPVTSAVEISLLSRSPDRDDRAQAEVLGMLGALMGEVRALAVRLPDDPYAKLRPVPSRPLRSSQRELARRIVDWLASQEDRDNGDQQVFSAEDIAEHFGILEDDAESVLEDLVRDNLVTEWTAVDAGDTTLAYSAVRP